MLNLKKLPFYRGKHNTFAASVQNPTLWFLVSVLAIASATATENAPKAQRVVCGAGAELSFALTEEWEHVDASGLGVMCAFRTKNSGFPTLTVVKTPPIPPYERRSLDSLRGFFERSYSAVGVKSARVLEVESSVAGDQPATVATIQFEVGERLMKALILAIEIPDRAYIATLQTAAAAFEGEKQRLFGVASSVVLEATLTDTAKHPVNPSGDSAAASEGSDQISSQSLLGRLLVVALISIGVVCVIVQKRRVRR